MTTPSTPPVVREPNRRRGYAIAAGAGVLATLLLAGLAYTVTGSSTVDKVSGTSSY
ncbi:hypothetical protein [Pseudonocardia sp. ICBG1142]|uniref:hypothetical protein n=1 Tax=Pseudonocardia sp. ICBG1142 TaxID=2846760 RepID=UPI001CF65E77|nr:hypothetical protein [Pseudonocardia sp. ICBG1142]